MKTITLKQIIEKIKKIKFEKFDLIVAIGKDGIMPASLLRYFVKAPVEVIWINYRNKDNKPIRETPILTKPLNKKLENKKILLVDTVSRSGKTLAKAKELLEGNDIKTFVINGSLKSKISNSYESPIRKKADYSLFNFKECIDWPW